VKASAGAYQKVSDQITGAKSDLTRKSKTRKEQDADVLRVGNYYAGGRQDVDKYSAPSPRNAGA